MGLTKAGRYSGVVVISSGRNGGILLYYGILSAAVVNGPLRGNTYKLYNARDNLW